MKRQVWLDLKTGEFSNSWDANEYKLDDIVPDDLDGSVKLIEYECKTDPDFEFNMLMKLR